MRLRPHNRTFWRDYTFVRARERVVPNQSIPRVRTLVWSDALEHTYLVGFLRRALSADLVSLPSRCP